MSEDLKHITSNLIQLGVLPDTLTTSEVVSFLKSKKYHRRAMYRDDVRLMLEAKRTGAGKMLVFNTKKVIELKLKLNTAI